MEPKICRDLIKKHGLLVKPNDVTNPSSQTKHKKTYNNPRNISEDNPDDFLFGIKELMADGPCTDMNEAIEDIKDHYD